MQRSEDGKLPYFTPKWFRELLLGRLSFGDTFWAGLLGSALVFVPVGVLVAIIVNIYFPGILREVLIALNGFYAVYLLLLLRVVLILGWAYKGAGGWKWFGMLYLIVQTSLQCMLVWGLITEGLELF